MNFGDLVKNNSQIIKFVNEWPGRNQPFHIKKELLLNVLLWLLLLRLFFVYFIIYKIIFIIYNNYLYYYK